MTRPAPSLLLTGPLALALIVLLLPMWLLHPLLLDQLIYSYVGKTILAGGAPYLDAWEQKGPLLHLVYAALLGIGQGSEMAIRLFDTAFTLLTLALVFLMAKRQSKPLLGAIAICVMLVFTPLTAATTAQADNWSIYLGLIMAFLLLEPAGNTRNAFTAGLLQGVCLMLKPTTALFSLMALVRMYREPRRWQLLALYGAGSTLIPLCLLLWLGLHGALQAFWDDYIIFNLLQHPIKPAVTFAAVLAANIGDWPGLVLIAKLAYLPLTVWGWWQLRQEKRALADVVASLFIAGFAAWCLQGHSNSINHMVVFLLPAGLLVAAAVERTPILALVIAPYLFCLFFGSGYNIIPSWQYLLGQIDRPAYLTSYDFANYSAPRMELLGQRIEALSPPGAPVYVFGFSPAPLIYANRMTPTRYFFSYPLIKGTDEQLKAPRAQLLADLNAQPPALIIVMKFDVSLLTQHASSWYFERFDQLKDFVSAHYQPVEDNADWIIYKRN